MVATRTPVLDRVRTRPLAIRSSAAKLRRILDRLWRDERYGEAVEVARDLARIAPSRKVYFQLGFLEREVGQYRSALHTFRDALRFATGEKYLIPEIHLHVAYTSFLMRDRRRMAKALSRAYRARRKPRTGFAFHMTWGTHLFYRHRYDEALEEYCRAAEVARKAIDRARAASNAGLVLLRQGKLAASKVWLDRALRIQKWKRMWTELASTRAMKAGLHFDSGRPKLALSVLERAAKAFRRFGKNRQLAEVLQNAGYIAGEIGLWTRSCGDLDRAIAIAGENGWWQIESRALACRAVVYARQEIWTAAQEDLARAKNLLRGHREEWCSFFIARSEARLAAMYGDWAEVRRAARHGERVVAKIGDRLRVAEIRRLRAEAEAALGRVQASDYAHASAARLAESLGPSSDVMARLLDRAARFAETNLPILIVGEPATGKRDLARWIHGQSARASRPCVRVPCDQLKFVASELCGHVRGAWSGATSDKLGYVRKARGGTVILERLDFLSKEDQQILIPIVDRRIRPQGSVDEEIVDVRFVATCEDADRLHPSLLARFGSTILAMPNLRERKDEIPALMSRFLKERRRVTLDALAELREHSWDGNVAEFEAAVERLVIATDHTIGCRAVRSVLKGTKPYSPPRRDTIRQQSARAALVPQ